MKQDSLEQFVRRNRKQLDTEVPDIAVWSKIANELPRKRSIIYQFRNLLSIAASAVVLLGIGVLIGLQLAPTNEAGIAKVAPELEEVERFYTNKIDYNLVQLANYQETIDPVLQEDLSELDEWMEHLHQDLKEVPKGERDKIVNAIINSYKKKLDILEHVLEHARTHPHTEEATQSTDNNISI